MGDINTFTEYSVFYVISKMGFELSLLFSLIKLVKAIAPKRAPPRK